MSRRCPTKWVAETVYSLVLVEVIVFLWFRTQYLSRHPREDSGFHRAVRAWLLCTPEHPGFDALFAVLYDLENYLRRQRRSYRLLPGVLRPADPAAASSFGVSAFTTVLALLLPLFAECHLFDFLAAPVVRVSSKFDVRLYTTFRRVVGPSLESPESWGRFTPLNQNGSRPDSTARPQRVQRSLAGPVAADFARGAVRRAAQRCLRAPPHRHVRGPLRPGARVAGCARAAPRLGRAGARPRAPLPSSHALLSQRRVVRVAAAAAPPSGRRAVPRGRRVACALRRNVS